MELMKYESERQVLGSLVLYPDKFGIKIPLLSDDLFADETHKKIFQSMRRIYRRNTKIDQSLVISELNEPDFKKEMVACAESIITTATFDDHLNILKKSAKQRFIAEAVEKMRLDGEYSENELINVCTLAKQAYDCDFRRYENAYQEFLKHLDKPKDVIFTHLETFNRKVGGLRKGTIFIIGARPSAGKTALALNIASYNALKGKKVIIFSLEMSSDMIIERLLSDECNIDYGRFTGTLTFDEKSLINDYFNSRGKSLIENLIVVDDVNAVENICAQIENNKPELVIVDFIQIVTTLCKSESVRARIDYISSELKRIAKRTNCCIIVLSQLSRAGENAPRMSDLRESGSLEQDGDCIALLDRPFVQDKENNPPYKATLLVDKNKFGKTGKIDLFFDGAHQRFTTFSNMKLQEKL